MTRAHAVDLKQAQSRLEELVDHAAHGADVILTHQGQPVARIISTTLW